MHNSLVELLTTRRFVPLMLTQLLGAFNDNLFKNALVMLITYRITEHLGISAQVLVQIASIALILPFVIFSALAGQLADKYDKAWLSKWIKFTEIILMLGAALGFYLQDITWLMIMLFLMGAQSTFFGPIKYGILPDHLQNHELVAGNALIETTTFLAVLTGAMVGGLVILNEQGVWLISLLVIGVALLGWFTSLMIPPTHPAMPQLRIGYNVITTTWEIVAYARNNRIVFLCILAISWFWMLGANFLVLFPALAKDVIGANEQVGTLFLLSFSLGITTGSLLCNQLLHGEIHAAYAPLGLLGITLCATDAFFASRAFSPGTELIGLSAFLQLPGSWRLLFSLTMVAVAGGLFIVPLYAMLQKHSDEAYRSRNIAASNIINAFFIVMGGGANMVLLYRGVTIPEIFLFMAILNLAVIAIIYPLPEAMRFVLLAKKLFTSL